MQKPVIGPVSIPDDHEFTKAMDYSNAVQALIDHAATPLPPQITRRAAKVIALHFDVELCSGDCVDLADIDDEAFNNIIDPTAFESARHAAQRRDDKEALFQLARACPDFSGLQARIAPVT